MVLQPDDTMREYKGWAMGVPWSDNLSANNDRSGRQENSKHEQHMAFNIWLNSLGVSENNQEREKSTLTLVKQKIKVQPQK